MHRSFDYCFYSCSKTQSAQSDNAPTFFLRYEEGNCVRSLVPAVCARESIAIKNARKNFLDYVNLRAKWTAIFLTEQHAKRVARSLKRRACIPIIVVCQSAEIFSSLSTFAKLYRLHLKSARSPSIRNILATTIILLRAAVAINV